MLKNINNTFNNIPALLKIGECPITVCLLPTGTDTKDFIGFFDFGEITHKIKNGNFVRPKLEIWASRPDIDLNQLAFILKKDFSEKLEKLKQQSLTDYEQEEIQKQKQIELLKMEKEDTGKEVENSFNNAISSGIGGVAIMQFLSLPFLHIILFGAAIYTGVQGAKKLLDYSYLAFKLIKKENNIEEEKRRIKTELDSNNQSFIRAVKKLKINIHPILQETLTSFHQIEGTAFSPTKLKTPPDGFPSVYEYFRDKHYLEELKQRLNQNYNPHYYQNYLNYIKTKFYC